MVERPSIVFMRSTRRHQDENLAVCMEVRLTVRLVDYNDLALQIYSERFTRTLLQKQIIWECYEL